MIEGMSAPQTAVTPKFVAGRTFSRSEQTSTIDGLAVSILRGSIKGAAWRDYERVGGQVLAPFVRSQLGTGTLDWGAAEVVALKIRHDLKSDPLLDPG